MIERKFIAQKIKEKQIQEFILGQLEHSGHNRIEIKRTPLGEKITIYTSRPGLIVGKKGDNIRRLTSVLKTRFNMENPQVEVGEIESPDLDANAVADRIISTFERLGPKRFKFVGYDVLKSIINAGAIGAEIVIGGRGVPGARAKSWRFSAGYLKKSGDVSETQVRKAQAYANLKSGTIGVKVNILPPNVKFPDKIKVIEPQIKVEPIIEEKLVVKEEIKEEEKEIKQEKTKKTRTNATKKSKKLKETKVKEENGSAEEK